MSSYAHPFSIANKSKLKSFKFASNLKFNVENDTSNTMATSTTSAATFNTNKENKLPLNNNEINDDLLIVYQNKNDKYNNIKINPQLQLNNNSNKQHEQSSLIKNNKRKYDDDLNDSDENVKFLLEKETFHQNNNQSKKIKLNQNVTNNLNTNKYVEKQNYRRITLKKKFFKGGKGGGGGGGGFGKYGGGKMNGQKYKQFKWKQKNSSCGGAVDFNLHHANNNDDADNNDAINQNDVCINDLNIPTTSSRKKSNKKLTNLNKEITQNEKTNDITFNTMNINEDDCPDNTLQNANNNNESDKKESSGNNNKNKNEKSIIKKKKQRTRKEHNHSDHENDKNKTNEPNTKVNKKSNTKTKKNKNESVTPCVDNDTKSLTDVTPEKKSNAQKKKSDSFIVSEDDDKVVKESIRKIKRAPKKIIVENDEQIVDVISDDDSTSEKLKTKQTKSQIKKINDLDLVHELFPGETQEKLDYTKMHVFKLNQEITDGLLEKVLERYFKHKHFKPFQKEAIIRVCSGVSTLCVMSTGYGKSLIYQFCTKLYSLKYKKNCLSIIVSPLISLMQDQLVNLSKHLRGEYYDVSMSYEKYQELCTNVKNGDVNLLFTSPESLIANRNLKDLLKNSCIPFVCIDEIHCLSAWSHNFRPSFLQICDFLRSDLNVSCILGLTATATIKTISEITQQTGILEENVIKNNNLPLNLVLSISCDKNKEKGLIDFLKKSNSIDSNTIIYCTRRDQTERLATMLRMNFNAQIAEAYHAGLTATQRKRIQKAFLSGKLKIIVATVAFGMGINMSNVKTIIHFNMPICIENYTQEIGRAGRSPSDKARCHLFLDKQNIAELNDIKKFIYANDYDHVTIKKFLNKIFQPCVERKPSVCTHEHLIPIDDLVSCLNLTLESIQTLICYLNSEFGLKLISSTAFSEILVKSYDDRVFNEPKHAVVKILGDLTLNSDRVRIGDILAKAKCGYFELVRHLKTFQFESKKNVNITYENSALYLRHDCLGHISGAYTNNLDRLFEILLLKTQTQNSFSKKNFLLLFQILNESSFKTVNNMYDLSEDTSHTRSTHLKTLFDNYFSNKLNLDDLNLKDLNDYYVQSSVNEDSYVDLDKLKSMIKHFISVYGGNDLKLNGRLVANIFHGIQTPNYPANIWGSNRQFWRAALDFDYELVLKTANELFIR